MTKTNFISLFEFSCEIFGYDNATSLDSRYVRNFYDDWKNNYPSMSINQYKKILNTRG